MVSLVSPMTLPTAGRALASLGGGAFGLERHLCERPHSIPSGTTRIAQLAYRGGWLFAGPRQNSGVRSASGICTARFCPSSLPDTHSPTTRLRYEGRFRRTRLGGPTIKASGSSVIRTTRRAKQPEPPDGRVEKLTWETPGRASPSAHHPRASRERSPAFDVTISRSPQRAER